MPHTEFEISFSSDTGVLRAHVKGEGTLDNTLSYWHQIAEELDRRTPVHGLLLIDEMHGEPLSAAQWQQLVQAMGDNLRSTRIAHVKPLGLQAVEFCEIYALEAGIAAQVFSGEVEADLWLRHGLT